MIEIKNGTPSELGIALDKQVEYNVAVAWGDKTDWVIIVQNEDVSVKTMITVSFDSATREFNLGESHADIRLGGSDEVLLERLAEAKKMDHDLRAILSTIQVTG